ncbi:FAD-dependent monooxygenase [Cellulomonas sp. ATA003]|nr:FAD-dependent monooxygenase [Cellulomonas sp. ATA003]WNB85652.1 FAD-dependent monooxygenase [Cellulomonas sp. ATA003]
MVAALGESFVVLRRSVLVDLLVAALPPGTVRLGTPVRAVQAGERGRRAVVTVDDGALEADLVVAADGARSSLRGQLFPGHRGVRYAGYVAWRLMPAPGPAVPVDQFETWGRGRRFSALPMAGGEVYCWATVTLPPGRAVDDDRAELLSRFGGWHEPIPALIAATPDDRILRHDVVELAAPLPALHAGRVALVGDAGHALTPDLGQGGCLALEDAVTLALLTDRHATVDAALARYTAVRLPRVTRIAARSRGLARVGQAAGPRTTRLRDLAIRAAGVLPPSVASRGLTSVVGWRPDDDVHASRRPRS